MNLEEMQVVWNSQNEEALYGVNEAGLREILREKGRKFERLVVWQEIQTYAYTLMVLAYIGFILFANQLGLIETLTLFIAAGLWMPHTIATYLGRKRQKNRERISTPSLQASLDRDIEQIQDQIRTRKSILLEYIPPHFGIALVLVVIFGITGLSAWLIVPTSIFQILALVIEIRSQERLIDQKILPRKRELESLREKLTDSKS